MTRSPSPMECPKKAPTKCVRVDLPQHYPFLFPFSTRFSFLQSTSFGYARLILKWQNQQNQSNDSGSRHDDTFGYLGRLQRQKVRISRKHLLESAIKVLELYGSLSSVLEVEYFEEVGTGLGPTLEFIRRSLPVVTSKYGTMLMSRHLGFMFIILLACTPHHSVQPIYRNIEREGSIWEVSIRSIHGKCGRTHMDILGNAATSFKCSGNLWQKHNLIPISSIYLSTERS
jgi:hypothetical protein